MPVDPYGEPAIRTVQAPGSAAPASAGASSATIEPGEGGIRVVRAPAGAGDPGGLSAASTNGEELASRVPGRGEPASSPPLVAGEGGVRIVEAPGSLVVVPATPEPMPVDAYADEPGTAGGSSASPTPMAGAPSPSPVSTPSARSLDARTTVTTVTAAAGSPATPAIILSRGEVDGALDDFAKLATGFRASFTAAGVSIDDVSDGSIFHRAGLRAGDVITAIDGARLRSLDDAANLYARASTARAITVQLLRAGKPLAIHVTIH